MNPEIEELENILDAILRGVQEVLQSGEILSDEFQEQIANEITTLTQEIDQLYTAQQSQEVPPQPIATGANLGAPPSPIKKFPYFLNRHNLTGDPTTSYVRSVGDIAIILFSS